MKSGYYKVTFTTGEVKIMYWNGEEWERFESDDLSDPSAEVEETETLSVGGGGSGDDPD